jgi:hypothetical protein
VSFWFIQDTSLSNKIIARFQAGVPVRILCDPRASATYAGNQQILDQFRAAGIPMRYKVADCILHRKFMLFAGQGQIEFSGANYGPFFFVPEQPYQNYIDEAIYFTSDTSVLNSFKTIMDDMWTDTTNYGNYANIAGPLNRLYPTYPLDPELNFPPSADGSQSFYNRSLTAFNAETQKIDVIMYRITNLGFTNMTIAAVNRGIPVRLLTEQNEYRNPDRPWDAYNVDLLYNAGVQIRIRAHEGLNHEKVSMLYSEGLTIFGSSNWTGPSANCQAENNYFTAKSWFFNWFVNQFERKWNSTTETQPFTPLPPDSPVYHSPANNAAGTSTNVTLSWEGGPYAHKFDIYLGTNPNPPLLAADQFIGAVDNGSTPETYAPGTLQAGTKYYWRIVSKTMANMTASGPTWSFTTAGSPGPAPTVSSISPSTGSTNGGTQITIGGTNFVSGASVSIGGAAATAINVTSSTSITAVTPAHSAGTVSVVVTNPDGQSATLANSFTYTAPPPPPPPNSNDVVLYASEAPVIVGRWSVVSDSSAAGGARISNPDAGAPKLANPLPNPPDYFEMNFQAQANTAYRLWIRGKAQADYWGNDSVFAQFSDSLDGSGGSPVYRIGTSSGTAINLEDCSGCGLQGWGWQDNGWGVGVMGPVLYFTGSGTHTIRIQVREDGLSIDQIVLSPGTYLNTSPGALKNDTTIMPKSGGGSISPPAISNISPNTGTTAGGTSVSITGTNFASGATISIGGIAASNVNVANSTYITAVTPAHAAGTVDVVVSNPDGQSGTLTGGFTYSTPTAPPPTVTSVSPNAGPTSGGTTVTLTGTNFVSGATVSFGGVTGTTVNVTSSTSISVVTPAHTAGTVSVSVTNTDGQSGSLGNAYTYTGGETVLLADDFNDNSLNATMWNASNLFSGYTDSTLPVREINQRLEIGPLSQGMSGSHYAGIRSAVAYDFTNAYCYVAIVQSASSTTSADAMFTIGSDVNGYYRIYIEGSSLILQKRISGTKTTLLTAAYNSTNDKYWRIRHESASGNVIFETAADAGGAPGTWNVRYSEVWNSAIPLGAILFEIKAGTWQSEANVPGTVIFDNFRAAKP